MKKKTLALLAGSCVLTSYLSGCAASQPAETAGGTVPASAESTAAPAETTSEQTAAQTSEQVTEQTAAPADEEPERLSMSGLEKLRADGRVDYVLSSEGYVTWLSGDFYDGTVSDESGVAAVMDDLWDVLGLDENAKFVKGPGFKDETGNSYFMLKQYSGGLSVAYATVKVITDSSGKVLAVSSSAAPHVGAGKEMLISAEEAAAAAEKYLSEKFPETQYIFYKDTIGQTLVQYGNADGDTGVTQAYIVYTNNPGQKQFAGNLAYMAHYIAGDGSYVYGIPVSMIDDEYALSGSNADSVFTGKTVTEYTGEVTYHDGRKASVTVPVLYDEAEETYYLADPERKMAVMDHAELVYNGNTRLAASKNNSDWDDKTLITYSSYIKIYDAFASFGWYGTDAIGSPIAITTDYCDPDGTPINNAAYDGFSHGWSYFCSSPLNNNSECIDVIAHEYTHGYTYMALNNSPYSGVPGAINESFSDIVGNTIEKLVTGREDKDWDVGEDLGAPVRCMRYPNQHSQPRFVGDTYYVPINAEPTPYNDNSGVHVNNSLLAGVCVDLADAGMTPDEQLKFWLTTELSMVSLTGFDEMLPIMKFTAKLCGLEEYTDVIESSYTDRGLAGDLDSAVYADVEGCGRAVFRVEDSSVYQIGAFYMVDPETLDIYPDSCFAYPDKNNVMTIQMPEESGALMLLVMGKEDPSIRVRLFYTAEGWKNAESGIEPMTVELRYMEPLELEALVWDNI